MLTFCSQRLSVFCNLCQADTPLGKAFRQDNSLTSIPVCPYSNISTVTITPRPIASRSAATTSPAISSSQWSETLASFPQDVRDIILSGGLNAWLVTVGIPPCTCSCNLAKHQRAIRNYAISQGWIKEV